MWDLHTSSNPRQIAKVASKTGCGAVFSAMASTSGFSVSEKNSDLLNSRNSGVFLSYVESLLKSTRKKHTKGQKMPETSVRSVTTMECTNVIEMSHLLDVQFQASDGPRQRVQIRSWAMVATAWQHWPGVLRIVSFIVFHEPMAAYQKKIYSNVWWKYSNSSKLMVSFCCHVSSFKTFHMFSIYMWHAFDRLGHLINPVTIQLCFRPSPSCLDDLKSWTEIRIVFQKNSICSKLRISK